MKVNLDKSELILVGRMENVDDLVCELGCKVGSLPSTYFWMPLGASFKQWDKSRIRCINVPKMDSKLRNEKEGAIKA